MDVFLISLGSNYNKEENMNKARLLLNSYFPQIIYSKMLETDPVGKDFVLMFYNQLAIVSISNKEKEVIETLKLIEQELGRTAFDKPKSIVKMDLDILAINNRILKDTDFNRPYIHSLLQTFTFQTNLDSYTHYIEKYLEYSIITKSFI